MMFKDVSAFEGISDEELLDPLRIVFFRDERGEPEAAVEAEWYDEEGWVFDIIFLGAHSSRKPPDSIYDRRLQLPQYPSELALRAASADELKRVKRREMVLALRKRAKARRNRA